MKIIYKNVCKIFDRNIFSIAWENPQSVSDQKFNFVEQLASQCVHTQPVRTWFLQLPSQSDCGAQEIAGGCYVDIPSSFCSTEHGTAHSRGDAIHGNTCKPSCSCGSSEARAVFVGSAPIHGNAELGKSKNCLGSLEIKAELLVFVSGWASDSGKERHLKSVSIIRQLLQTVSSVPGSLFLHYLRKWPFVLRDTVAEMLFIGIAHMGTTSPPTVKAGE